MPRLVIDARESGTSTGRYIDKLVEYLHELKPDFEVVVLTKASRVGDVAKLAPDFTIVESNFKEFSFAEQLGFAWQLYKLKADLVHFNAPQQPLLYLSPSITTVHDLTTARFNNPAKNWLLFKIKQQIYKFAVYWVAHKSKKIIAISKYVKADLAAFAHISQNKIEVTYEAADKVTEPAQSIAELAGKKFILYVGRPTPHKNLNRLVEAMAQVKESQPETVLVLAGKNDKNYDNLKKFIDEKYLTSQVFLTGFVSEAQLRWLYENAQVYAFPSLSEGFGLPGLEAMNYSLPVAASNATCLPEIYKDAALYFDAQNVSDIAAKLIKLLENQDLRDKLSKAGLDLVKTYSWEKMATQTLEIYREFLD